MSGFVSVFRIGGLPILPPLMTVEIREEMIRYRNLAIEIEQRIQISKEINIFKTTENCNQIDPSKSEEKIEINEIVSNHSSCDRDDEKHLDNITVCLTDSTNQISDEQDEILVFSNRDEIYSSSFLHSQSSISDTEDTSITSVISSHIASISKSTNVSECNFNENDSSRKDFKLECGKNQEEESFSNVNDEPVLKLVRSNSYTLDNPSPMFIKHMKDQGLDVTTVSDKDERSQQTVSNSKSIKNDIKKTITSKTKEILLKQKILPLRRRSKNDLSKSQKRLAAIYTPKKSSYVSLNTSNSRISQSKLELKPITKSSKLSLKGGNKAATNVQSTNSLNTKSYVILREPSPKAKLTEHKENLSKIKSQELISKQLNNIPFTPQTSKIVHTNEDRILDYLTRIEEEHKNQMKMLIEQQQIEQHKMQEAFLKQQQLLLHQITANTLFKSQGISSPFATESNSSYESASNNISLNESHCKEFNNNSLKKEGSSEENFNYQCESRHSNIENISKTPYCNRRLFEKENAIESDEQKAKKKAATIINAYARGYLVRRLFKTEDVQTVIKIIRDTLLFILDLHHESATEQSPADIKLKRTLLQQLNSACYSLHDIFFNRTIAERMEIIATDRELMHRKFNKNKLTSSMVTASGSSKNLQKLKKMSLFPVNILGEKTKASSSEG